MLISFYRNEIQNEDSAALRYDPFGFHMRSDQFLRMMRSDQMQQLIVFLEGLHAKKCEEANLRLEKLELEHLENCKSLPPGFTGVETDVEMDAAPVAVSQNPPAQPQVRRSASGGSGDSGYTTDDDVGGRWRPGDAPARDRDDDDESPCQSLSTDEKKNEDADVTQSLYFAKKSFPPAKPNKDYIDVDDIDSWSDVEDCDDCTREKVVYLFGDRHDCTNRYYGKSLKKSLDEMEAERKVYMKNKESDGFKYELDPYEPESWTDTEDDDTDIGVVDEMITAIQRSTGKFVCPGRRTRLNFLKRLKGKVEAIRKPRSIERVLQNPLGSAPGDAVEMTDVEG